MNIGEKINYLFDQSGYKNYADWGKAMGVPGDWLNDMKKKEVVKVVDITRFITFVEFNHITLEELLKNDRIVDTIDDLPFNDIYAMLNQIQLQLQESESKFNGFTMNKESKEIAFDAIEVLKGLVKSNL